MDNALMTIIGIFLAATLIFVVPLMSISERNDDIAQSVVQTATSEFVDKIAISGVIKPSDYEEYEQKLSSTGNTYEIEIEVQHLDENFGKKNGTTSNDLIGENERYSTFTTEVLGNMYNEDGTSQNYLLKKGDNVIVTAKNTNKTMAQTLRTFIYRVTGKGTYEIAANSSSMVVNDGGKTQSIQIGDSNENVQDTKLLYLYNYGNECTDITGGWYPSIISDWENHPDEAYTGAIYEKKSSYLYIGDKSEDAYADGSFSTYEKIEELKDYDKLHIKFKIKSAYWSDRDESASLFTVYFTENPQFIEYKDYENDRENYKKRIGKNQYEDCTIDELKSDYGNNWRNQNGIVYEYVIYNSNYEAEKIGQEIEFAIPLTDEIKQNITDGFHITLRGYSHSYYQDKVEAEVYQVYLTKGDIQIGDSNEEPEQNEIVDKKEVVLWEQDETQIYGKAEDGTIITTLQIGDYINYDCTNGGNKYTYTSPSNQNGYGDQTFTTRNDLQWRVIGVEHNNLLISSSIPSFQLYFKNKNNIQEINNISKIFDNGYGALENGGRSINKDDIISLCRAFGEDHSKLDRYGNGTEIFVIYLTDGDYPTENRNENYLYFTQANEKLVDLIFPTRNRNDFYRTGFWIANTYTYVSNNFTHFGIYGTWFAPEDYATIYAYHLFNASDWPNGRGLNVRPVVTLKTDIELEHAGTYNQCSNWNII